MVKADAKTCELHTSQGVFELHPNATVRVGAQYAPIALGKHFSSSGNVIQVDGTGPTGSIQQIAGAISAGREFFVSNGSAHAATTLPGQRGYFQCTTSGTTSAAKLIRRTNASWIASFALNVRLGRTGRQAQIAVLGRLGHTLALFGAIEALHVGAGLSLLASLRPNRQTTALAAHKSNVLYASPTQLRLITDAWARQDMPPLDLIKTIFCGGAKLDKITRDALLAIFPNATILEFYGSSETSFVTVTDFETPQGSVGRAYEGVELSIRDPADGPTRVGTIGEIWVRSPYVFSGYLTRDYGDTRWDDGWLSVGEFGRLDSAGYLYLAGRKSRMITVADTNVFPEQVEEFLLTIGGVSRAAVLAKPDKARGNVLVGYIQLSDKSLQSEKIMNLCRGHLGPMISPREITVLAHWPTLSGGKTDLVTLQKDAS